MIFCDTGAWFALFVPPDPDHGHARQWISQNKTPLLTTDYIIDELLTLLLCRGEHQRANLIGEQMFAGTLCNLEYVTEDDVRTAWDIFKSHHDKKWSFTDCTSFAVMERLQVDAAFSFDHHFLQRGTIHVVPQSK